MLSMPPGKYPHTAKSFFRGAFLFSCLLCTALLTGPLRLSAQRYYFDNYSVSGGLAQSKVFTIIQDRNDYIWLGTEGGASRFDGLNFENYSSEDGMAINGVRSIYEDAGGMIWFGHTGGGITRFNGHGFEIYRGADTLLQSDITSISQDRRGQVWITAAEHGALRILNPEAPSSIDFRVETFRGGNLSDRVYDLVTGRDGSLYFITDLGVQKQDSSGRFERFTVEGMGYFQVTSFLEDSRGNFWFGTYNDGLYRYHPGREGLDYFNTRNGLAHNFVSTIFEDSRGDIWIGTWGGGITRSRDGALMNFNNGNGLQDLKIWSIMEDVEGNVLIGTSESGLSIFKGEEFVSFDEGNGLVNDQVWSVLQDREGRFWFGTNGGISIYSPTAIAGTRFRHLTAEHYPIDNQVRFLKEDRQGHIWVGTYGNGTYEFNPRTFRFSYSFPINSYNRQLIVTAMEIDGNNNLWVGTTDGLIFYDIDAQQVQFLSQVHGLAGTDISALFADSRGTVWVGAKGRGISTVQGDSIRPLALENQFTPTCFAEGEEGMIWVGTEGQGIFGLKDREPAMHFSREDGLLTNLITLVRVDTDNNLWIGSNQGLNRYSPAEKKIYTYMEKNGFTGIEAKSNASILDSEGRLWFGTVGGVFRYDPSKEERRDIEPLTHITGMRVNLEERDMAEGLRLSYRENSVIFDFNSICLTNPDIVSYRYMLEGADQDWLPQTRQTTATYPALRPGRYVFSVKARNSRGKWNTEPVSYAFQIRPPFYATWYFILACVLAGGLGILTYIKMRTAKLRRENLILEEKVRLRTAQVVAQKEELAEKNKDITDSIQYARRIQFAILPPDVPFQDTFILFKPKDIVSGDFYWLLEKEGTEYIAAVDCTGHGVPGAFMSIIGHNMLNKIVKEYGVEKPSEIIKYLDREVSRTLHQEGDHATVLDGMDMTILAWHPDRRMIEFAGAINPVYMVREGELIETKGDRFPIGRTPAAVKKEFTNHEIKVRKGDTVYMFSDGYADQFGGDQGKKFKIAPMKEVFLAIQEKTMEEQSSILNSTIEAWRGDYEQVDDILVIGRRF